MMPMMQGIPGMQGLQGIPGMQGMQIPGMGGISFAGMPGGMIQGMPGMPGFGGMPMAMMNPQQQQQLAGKKDIQSKRFRGACQLVDGRPWRLCCDLLVRAFSVRDALLSVRELAQGRTPLITS